MIYRLSNRLNDFIFVFCCIILRTVNSRKQKEKNPIQKEPIRMQKSARMTVLCIIYMKLTIKVTVIM